MLVLELAARPVLFLPAFQLRLWPALMLWEQAEYLEQDSYAWAIRTILYKQQRVRCKHAVITAQRPSC
jgi:hypothetical protein